MKNIPNVIAFAIIILFCSKSTFAQKEILYVFNQEIVDSLKSGIKLYQSISGSKKSNLEYFAIIRKDNDTLEIFLQQYTSLKKGALRNLIIRSNRKVFLDSRVRVPVLLLEDLYSGILKSEKLSTLPLTGYYIKAAGKNFNYVVLDRRFLY